MNFFVILFLIVCFCLELFIIFYFPYRFNKRAKACKHYCPDCKNKYCQFFSCLKKAHPGSYNDKFTVKYFYGDRAKEQ